MLLSTFQKEWLKVRYFFMLLVLLNIGMAAYIFFDIRARLHSEHAEMVWYQAIHIHTVFYQDFRFVPLISALVLAAAQFVPEILQRRLRIGLHLPVGRDQLIALYLALGLFFYGLACGLGSLLIVAINRFYFPREVALSSLTTVLPWLLAGIIAYLGSATLLFEPQKKRQAFILCLFAGLLTLFFQGHGYGWYDQASWAMLLLLPLCFVAVFASSQRFLQGGHSS